MPTTSPAGTQMAQASETNKDLKDQMKKDKQSALVAKSQSTNVSQTQTAENKPKEFDDTPIWQRKVQAA